MATANSTASTPGLLRSQRFEMGGESQRPRTEFDANVPAGVDPEAAWRYGSSDRFRRHGTTAAERAGLSPGYTPGYGRSAAANSGSGNSLTPRAQWDAGFQQHLTPAAQADHKDWLWPTGGAATPEHPGLGAAPSQISTMPPSQVPPAGGGIPSPGPAAPAPTPGLPVLPPSPGLTGASPQPPMLTQANDPTFDQTDPSAPTRPIPGNPRIQQTQDQSGVNRTVTGLPAGQRASSTFVPGQNSPKNIAKRQPVDPLAT